MGSRRLLKLKLGAKTNDVFIRYDQENRSSVTRDEFSIKSNEPPKAELRTALDTMAEHVIEICELPEDMKELLLVLGVSVSYNDDNIQGLIITCQRALKHSNTPMIINTPNFSREPYSETADPDVNVFSAECAESLDDLEEKAFAYVDGDRAQRELDFGEPKKPETHGMN